MISHLLVSLHTGRIRLWNSIVLYWECGASVVDIYERIRQNTIGTLLKLTKLQKKLAIAHWTMRVIKIQHLSISPNTLMSLA